MARRLEPANQLYEKNLEGVRRRLQGGTVVQTHKSKKRLMQSPGPAEGRLTPGEEGASAVPAKSQVAETGGVGISRLAQEAPQSLPGARPQNRKQIQVICQALGSLRSWGVAVVPEKRTSGVDSDMSLAAGTSAHQAARRDTQRKTAGWTECGNPIQYLLAHHGVNGGQIFSTDYAIAKMVSEASR